LAVIANLGQGQEAKENRRVGGEEGELAGDLAAHGKVVKEELNTVSGQKSF